MVSVRALPVALLVTLLVGCGGGEPELDSLRPVPRGTPTAESTPSADADAEPSADQLLAEATASLREAPRFAMAGTAIGATDRIEFSYVFGTGGDVEGRTVDRGVTLGVRVVDGTYYLNGDEAFWAASLGTAAAPGAVAATQRALAGRWVEVSAADAASLRDLTRERLLAEYLPTGRAERVAGRDVGGATTLGVRADGGTVYLDATSREPLLVVLDDGSTARLDLEPAALAGVPADAVRLSDLT